MSVKSRIAELNARFAEKLTAKGVEASADETTTALIDKVGQIEQGGTVEGLVMPKDYFTNSSVYIPAITADMITGELICDYGFAYFRLEKLELPSTIRSIRSYAFEGAKIRQPLVIPDSVEGTQVSIFRNSSINHITMSINVETPPNSFLQYSTCETLIWRGNMRGQSQWAFSSARSLVNFSVGGKINDTLVIGDAPLTLDSAKNIINALEDYAGTENEFVNTITFSSTTLAYLEAEGATAPNGLTWIEYADSKGWNIT